MRKLEHTIRERQILKPSRGSIKPGDKFNQLTVLRTNVDRRGGVYYHECQCDCGKVKVVRSNNVKTTLSCGCAHQGVNKGLKIILNPGDVYGKLTLVRESDIKVGAYNKWDCICECGNEHTVSRQSLIRGTTRSCGCLRIENLKKLGLEKKMNNEQDKKAEEILDAMLAAPQGAQLTVNDFGQLTIDNGDGTGSILVNLMPMARQDGWSETNDNGRRYQMKELFDKVRGFCKDKDFKITLPDGVHSLDDLLTRNCRTEISINGIKQRELSLSTRSGVNIDHRYNPATEQVKSSKTRMMKPEYNFSTFAPAMDQDELVASLYPDVIDESKIHATGMLSSRGHISRVRVNAMLRFIEELVAQGLPTYTLDTEYGLNVQEHLGRMGLDKQNDNGEIDSFTELKFDHKDDEVTKALKRQWNRIEERANRISPEERESRCSSSSLLTPEKVKARQMEEWRRKQWELSVGNRPGFYRKTVENSQHFYPDTKTSVLKLFSRGNYPHPASNQSYDYRTGIPFDVMLPQEPVLGRLYRIRYEHERLRLKFKDVMKAQWNLPLFLSDYRMFCNYWDKKLESKIHRRNDASWQFFPEWQPEERPCGFSWDSNDEYMTILTAPTRLTARDLRGKPFFTDEEMAKQFPHMPKPHEVWAALPHHWRIRQYVKQSTR